MPSDPSLKKLEAGYYETELTGVTLSIMKCGDGRWRIYQGSEGANRWKSYRNDLEAVGLFGTLGEVRLALQESPDLLTLKHRGRPKPIGPNTATERHPEIKTYARDLGTHIIGPKHSSDYYIAFNCEDYWWLGEPIGRLRDVPIHDLCQIIAGRADYADKHSIFIVSDWTRCIATGHRLRDVKRVVSLLHPEPTQPRTGIRSADPSKGQRIARSGFGHPPSLLSRFVTLLTSIAAGGKRRRGASLPLTIEDSPSFSDVQASRTQTLPFTDLDGLPRTFFPATKKRPVCLWPAPRQLRQTPAGNVLIWGVELDPSHVPDETRERIEERSYDDLSGLNVGAPLSVYYVRIDCTDGKTLYKFGVTRHESVLPRFKRELESNRRIKDISLLRTYRCESGWTAVALEQGLLRHFAS